MLNNVSLIGRAVSDPETSQFSRNGQAETLAKVRIAVDRPTKEKKSDFFQIEVYGKQAEVAANYVKRGHMFGVEGRLKLDTWTDKEGKNQSRVVVTASRIILLPNQKQEQESDAFAAFR